MAEIDINGDWSESSVSINTSEMRDMLPSISSDVQIIEIGERESDTQSVCKAAEDVLGNISKDNSDFVKKNSSASDTSPHPPPLSPPPFSLTLKPNSNVHYPPELPSATFPPPSKEPTVARETLRRPLRPKTPLKVAAHTGPIKETVPPPPHPPDKFPFSGDLPRNARLDRPDGESSTPLKTRGRLIRRIFKGFKKVFRRRSPPPTPVEKAYVSIVRVS